MSIMLKNVVFFLTLVTIVSAVRNSKFIKTKVKLENSDCTSKFSPSKISTIRTTSSLLCGSLCSSDGDCRRYQFNSRLKQCQLFDSGDNCYVSDQQEVESTVCLRLKSLYDANNNIRCPIGYYGDQCQHVIKECAEGIQMGVVPQTSKMSFIRPSQSLPVKEVKCDFEFAMDLIFVRQTNCKEVDFNRTWDEYVTGFGDPYGNYWIGLEYIYFMSQRHIQSRVSVHVTMANPKRNHRAYYKFNIANKSDNYRVSFYQFSSNPDIPTDDIFATPGYSIDGRPFSTYDRDFSSNDCPRRFNGGWWYLDNQNCSLVNLVGKVGTGTNDGNLFWFGNNTRFADLSRFYVKLSDSD